MIDELIAPIVKRREYDGEHLVGIYVDEWPKWINIDGELIETSDEFASLFTLMRCLKNAEGHEFITIWSDGGVGVYRVHTYDAPRDRYVCEFEHVDDVAGPVHLPSLDAAR